MGEEPVTPRISVIIPTFGRPEFLEETLRSVAAQTYPAFQVIVVDDCSEVPVEIPDQLDLPVTLLRHVRNQGSAAARNTGLAHATGEWVMFLDDDDLLTPRRLELAVHNMGAARAHAAAVEVFSPSGKRLLDRRFEGDLREVFLNGEHPWGRHPMMGQMVHRREDVVQFDPTFRRAQDTDWWLRLSDRAVFAWSPEVGLRVREHPEARPDENPDSRLLAMLAIARRHGPSSDRTRRAHLYGQVAGAALNARRRRPAFAWSVRALLSNPSSVAWKRLALAVLPRGIG